MVCCLLACWLPSYLVVKIFFVFLSNFVILQSLGMVLMMVLLNSKESRVSSMLLLLLSGTQLKILIVVVKAFALSSLYWRTN